MPPAETQFFAQSAQDLVTPAELVSMSGLDFMRGILEGRIAAPPIARVLNFSLERVAEGVADFCGAPDFDAMNPMGTVHGGWYGAILDSCMACAVMTTLPQGKIYTTLEYKVNIIRPIALGTEVRAVGRVQHAGRSTGVAMGELVGVADGRLYATGSTTCIIMSPK
ncbi:MAG: PaaI family thioesterase [Pseudomonadota bacterium]